MCSLAWFENDCSIVSFLCNLFWGFAFLIYDAVKSQAHQTETKGFVNKREFDKSLNYATKTRTD